MDKSKLTLTKDDFFFCYSSRLESFLKHRGIDYITKSINPNSDSVFTIWYKNQEFSRALDEYHKLTD